MTEVKANPGMRIRDLPAPLEPRPLPEHDAALSGQKRLLLGFGIAILVLTAPVWVPLALLTSFVYLYGKFCLYITIQVLDVISRFVLGREPNYPPALLAALALPALVIVPPLVVFNSIHGIVQYYGHFVLSKLKVKSPRPAHQAIAGYALSPLLPLVVAGYVLYALAVEIVYGMILRPLVLKR